jgi:hypothetical protein
MAILKDGATPLTVNTDLVSAPTVGATVVVPSGSARDTTFTGVVSLPSGYYDISILSEPFTLCSIGSTAITPNTKSIYLNNTTTSISLNYNFLAPTTWTARTSTFGTTTISALAFGNNTFVAAGYAGQVRTSTDGITWTTRTLASLVPTSVRTSTFGNGTFVVAGNNGLLDSSTDGVTWTTRTSQFGIDVISSSAFGNNIFVIGGFTGKISTSTDGISWTTRTSAVFNNLITQELAFGNNLFVAGTNGGTVATSTDGATWTSRISPFNTQITGLTFGNNLFLISSTSGQLATSTDGITWTTRNSTVSGQINAIGFGNNYYVLGSGSDLRVSTDGITWTTGILNASALAFTFGNNTFVAAGDSGQLSTTESPIITSTENGIGLIKLPEASS